MRIGAHCDPAGPDFTGFQHLLVADALADVHQPNAVLLCEAAEKKVVIPGCRVRTRGKVVQDDQVVRRGFDRLCDLREVFDRRRAVDVVNHAGVHLHNHDISRFDRPARLRGKDFFNCSSHFKPPRGGRRVHFAYWYSRASYSGTFVAF